MKTVHKIALWVTGITILVVFVVIVRENTSRGEQKLSKQTSISQPSAITLGVGERIKKLPSPNQWTITVPSTGKGWTDWVAQAEGATCFWVKPEERVFIQVAYEDGTTSEAYEDSPLRRNPSPKRVTGARWQNTSAKPVSIVIQQR